MTQATPYQSFPNTFKRDLLAGKKLIGCWSSLSTKPLTKMFLKNFGNCLKYKR